MKFLAAKCPNCGGELRLPDDKKQVKCMYCGFDIIIKETVDNNVASVENLLKLATEAAESENDQEAYDYFTRVLEYESKNHIALLGKGISAAKLSDAFNFRSKELKKGVDLALKNVPDEFLQEFTSEISEQICLACIKFKVTQQENPPQSSKKDIFRYREENLKQDAEKEKILVCLELAHSYSPINTCVIEEIISTYSQLLITPTVEVRGERRNAMGNKSQEDSDYILELQKEINDYKEKRTEFISKLQKIDLEKGKSIIDEDKRFEDELLKDDQQQEQYLQELYSERTPATKNGSGCLIMTFIILTFISMLILSIT